MVVRYVLALALSLGLAAPASSQTALGAVRLPERRDVVEPFWWVQPSNAQQRVSPLSSDPEVLQRQLMATLDLAVAGAARLDDYENSRGFSEDYVLFLKPARAVGGVCEIPTVAVSFQVRRTDGGEVVRTPAFRTEARYLALGPLQGDTIRFGSGPCFEEKDLSGAFLSDVPIEKLHAALEAIDRGKLVAQFRPDLGFVVDCKDEWSGVGCFDVRRLLSGVSYRGISHAEDCSTPSDARCVRITGVLSSGEGWIVRVQWNDGGPSFLSFERHVVVVPTSAAAP